MSVLTDESPTCVLCAERKPPRHRALEYGRCCAGCAMWLHNTICEIGFLAAEAGAWITPRPGTKVGPTSFGSKPPINLEAIDPELALVELNKGDRSSAVPILAMLELWERFIRQAKGLVQYGPASHYRAVSRGRSLADTGATLVGVVDFLSSEAGWMVDDDRFPLVEFADHVRRAVAILRRWQNDEQNIGTRIECPAQLEDGSCGTPIRVSSDGTPVTCRGCGHEWTVDWLIRVAGEDADGWADMEAVCRLSGLHERTIRRWAAAGKVRKRGLLYNVRDVSDCASKAISA